ncbi:hypothetical protein ABKN59_000288 [Abortiporus biennis]
MYDMSLQDNYLVKMMPEEQLEYYEDDYDYDVYLFWPSGRPDGEFQGDFVDVLELPTITHTQSELEDRIYEWNYQHEAFLPPLSPTYTTASDIVFPDIEASAQDAGYSRLFRAGLHATSRHVGVVWRKFCGQLESTKHWLTA